MILFFIAAIMAVFCLNFKLIAVILKRSSVYFNEHKKYGTGEVVGYSANSTNGESERTRRYSLLVKVIELNDNKTYDCGTVNNIHDYPKGSIVKVVYAITKRGRVQVYLTDSMPADKSSMSKVFNIISLISLIITLGLVMIGVITMLI